MRVASSMAGGARATTGTLDRAKRSSSRGGLKEAPSPTLPGVPRPSVSAVVLTALVAVTGCDLGSDEERASTERPREAESRGDSGPAALVGRLRRGGYVLAFRHAATDFSMTDSTRDLSDCSRQRNLTAEGRRQARSIGREFRRLGIPVGRVLASPFCRTRETATLAFGRVVPSRALLSADFFEGEPAGERQPSRLRQLLASPPRGATNTILVSHNFAIDDATGESLAEGEAVIVTPREGRPGFEVVARLKAGAWARLGRAAARLPRVKLREYKVFDGAGPHDVAPTASGKVWFTAQAAGELGRLDPLTGRVRRVSLGSGSAPHGVIVGPDRAAWVTDGGLNAIVRVDARSLQVRRFPLPGARAGANLNTATFDRRGRLWFTGQSGVYGRLNPRSGRLRVFDAPRGPGPYGISTAPSGAVWYASLAGSHIARIDTRGGRARIVEPPTDGQGARRIWPDSRGRLWISEWNAGKLGVYNPRTRRWREWRLPGANPQPYAVYVDEADLVWLTDFGANSLVRFDPARQRFESFELPQPGVSVRQLLGRDGEVWGAESATDRLVVALSRPFRTSSSRP
jgi:virginiamycin B lyase